MKKKLLCMALAVLMLCTFFLTSCSDNRTEDEIIADIVENSKRTAYTVSIMIPTDADTSSEEFQERLAAVEEAINVILRRDCTEIKIIAVNDADYDAAVASKMDKIKEKIDGGEKLPSTLVYENEAEKKYTNGTDGDYTIQLKYPDVLDTQLDIILVRDKQDYLSYASSGQLLSWNTDLASTGSWSRLTKIVKSDYLNLMAYGSNADIYGIPNNYSYTNLTYKFMFIDKSIASRVEGFDIENILEADGTVNYAALDDFLSKASALNNVCPLYANPNDVPNVDYWGDNGFSVIGSTDSSSAPSDVFLNQDYVDFMTLYKEYGNVPTGNSKVAVSILSANVFEAATLEEDYHIVKVGMPSAYEEDIFGSIFAVTKYAKDESRAKEIIFELQTNAEIRTLLQYGIKGEDYRINNGVIEMIKDNKGDYAYKMNPRYTGNGYLTYPFDNASMDVWEYVKDANHDSSFDPFEGFRLYYNNSSKKDQIDACTRALSALNEIVFEEIQAASTEEFITFITEWSNPDTTNENVLRIKDSDAYKNAMDAYTELYTEFSA